MVGVPEATENMRSAPVRALRAIFSGVGQLLLAADRLREEDAERERTECDDQPEPLGSWNGGPSSSVRIITQADRPARTVPDSGVSPAKQTSTAVSARAGQRPTSTASKKARGSGGTAGDRTSGQADRKASVRRSGRGKKSAEPTPFRSLDLTGNVRMLSDQDIADLAADALERGEARIAKLNQLDELTDHWSMSKGA